MINSDKAVEDYNLEYIVNIILFQSMFLLFSNDLYRYKKYTLFYTAIEA